MNGTHGVIERGFAPILNRAEENPRPAEGCFDCGRPVVALCPRCGNPLCDAHSASHQTFKLTHGRCYYGIHQDNAALRGVKP